MSVEPHRSQEENVAAYLLGALTDAETGNFERHMAECPVCREEVERLRPAVDALPRSVAPLEPPPELKAKLMAAVEADVRARTAAERRRPPLERLRGRLSERRRRLVSVRPALAWTGTAVVLAVGVLAGYAATELTSDESERSQRLAAQVDKGRIPLASGSLVLQDKGRDGAILRVHGMPRLGRDSVYQVWLKRGEEAVSQSLFSVNHDGSGTAAVPEDLGGADAVLVTRERAGGSPAPTEEPILSVTL